MPSAALQLCSLPLSKFVGSHDAGYHEWATYTYIFKAWLRHWWKSGTFNKTLPAPQGWHYNVHLDVNSLHVDCDSDQSLAPSALQGFHVSLYRHSISASLGTMRAFDIMKRAPCGTYTCHHGHVARSEEVVLFLQPIFASDSRLWTCVGRCCWGRGTHPQP